MGDVVHIAATRQPKRRGAPEAASAPGKRPRLAAKRKVALLVAYNGSRYQGLQRNPGADAIEDVLERALHAVGAISDDNVGTLQKISWSRAGRTDKGVHAVGQIISAKLMLLGGERVDGHEAVDGDDVDTAPTLAALNEELARRCDDVRVLGIARVTNKFCAHTGCTSREYEYLIPAYCLRPPDPAILKTDVDIGRAITQEAREGDRPLSKEEVERVNAALSILQGTHNFHNFTDAKGPNGPMDK